MEDLNSIPTFLQNNPIIGFLIASPALVLYLYLLVNEKQWIQFEIFLGVTSVLSLPFSGDLLSAWLDGEEGDVLAMSLFRLVMLGMIAQAATFYLTWGAKDPLIRVSLSISNILGRGGLLFCAVYALENVSGLSPIAVKGDCIFLSLLLIGDIAHMKKISTREGALKIGDAAQYCVTFDAIASFIIGAAFLGFPDAIVGIMCDEMKMSPVHEMFMKSAGFQTLASSILSFSCLCYKETDDAATLLKSKLVVYVPVHVAALYWYQAGPTIASVILIGNILWAQLTPKQKTE